MVFELEYILLRHHLVQGNSPIVSARACSQSILQRPEDCIHLPMSNTTAARNVYNEVLVVVRRVWCRHFRKIPNFHVRVSLLNMGDTTGLDTGGRLASTSDCALSRKLGSELS